MNVRGIFSISWQAGTKYPLADCFGNPYDRVQWRAQLVAHIGQKFRLRSVRPFSQLLGGQIVYRLSLQAHLFGGAVLKHPKRAGKLANLVAAIFEWNHL